MVGFSEIDSLPKEFSRRLEDLPEDCRLSMEFRLLYKGPLKSASSSSPRPEEAHAIRMALSIQLREYWRGHPHLSHMFDPNFRTSKSVVQTLGDQFDRNGHKFVPLMNREYEQYCTLHILFLRRGTPGKIVVGGDLDNRLKILFDALKVPDTSKGLGVSTGEPIFCLLQDDDQITTINLVADRLLEPLRDGEAENDIFLVIHVHIYRGTNVSQVIGQPGSQ
jgi:hypothetical protein